MSWKCSEICAQNKLYNNQEYFSRFQCVSITNFENTNKMGCSQFFIDFSRKV